MQKGSRRADMGGVLVNGDVEALVENVLHSPIPAIGIQ
jgi:hypothetical protein